MPVNTRSQRKSTQPVAASKPSEGPVQTKPKKQSAKAPARKAKAPAAAKNRKNQTSNQVDQVGAQNKGPGAKQTLPLQRPAPGITNPSRPRRTGKKGDKSVPNLSKLDQLTAEAVDRENIVESWAEGISGIKSLPFLPSETSSSVFQHSGIAEWYLSHGCQPPEEEMAATDVASSARQSDGPPRSKKVGASDTAFYRLLKDRNVDFREKWDDPNQELLKQLQLLETDVEKGDVETTKEEERCWEEDLLKCKHSHEPMIQRTVMMEMVDRHRLNDVLDYIVESVWDCPEVPRKNNNGFVRPKNPLPDLAFAFKTDRVLQDDYSDTALGELKGLMCPERNTRRQDERAFHFFSIEVKGALGDLENCEAAYQNLNTASQALYNMWRIFHTVGEDETFFHRVRFFSVIATRRTFSVRVHWALQEEKWGINEQTPLAFRFEELFELTGKAYSKSRVLGTVQKILVDYGTEVLLPILQSVMQKVLEAIKEEEKQAKEFMSSAYPIENTIPITKKKGRAKQPGKNIARKPGNSFNAASTADEASQQLIQSFSSISQASTRGSRKRRGAEQPEPFGRGRRRIETLVLSDG